MTSSSATTVKRTVPSNGAPYWVEEGVAPEGRSRFLAKIAGLRCSLCTGTIEKAIGRLPGVSRVGVSLTHEQALVEYDPCLVSPQDLLTTLKDIGYRVWDPRKLRPYEEEEAELVGEGKRLLGAIGVSLVAIALMLEPHGGWSLLLDAVVGLSLAALAFLILRSGGWAKTGLGIAALSVLAAGVFWANASGLAAPFVPWILGLFAVVVVFPLAGHFLRMAYQSIRRGILNQHVLLEFGAFAGLAGAVVGLVFHPAHYPTAPFFGVSVLIVTYHSSRSGSPCSSRPAAPRRSNACSTCSRTPRGSCATARRSRSGSRRSGSATSSACVLVSGCPSTATWWEVTRRWTSPS